ncbi:MAG: Sec-independent protein translocase protein TatB [Thermodesulfobacteriota bacterium]
MFGIGMPELILILVVALIVIGPKKLPDMAKSLGKAVNEFKSATQDFKDSIDTEVKDIKALDRKDSPGRVGKRVPENAGNDAALSEKEEQEALKPETDSHTDDIKTGIPEYDDAAEDNREKTVKNNE